MSSATTTRPTMQTTTSVTAASVSSSTLATPIYDGYATIRARGLVRTRSIRATEIEAEAANNVESTNDAASIGLVRAAVVTAGGPVERKRTLSLMSNFSQSSSTSSSCHNQYQQQQLQQQRRSSSHSGGGGSEDLYISRHHAKPVKTPTINDLEPLYSSNTQCFRPLSDASSSSGGGRSDIGGCRDSVLGSTGSGDYHSTKKNSRFSLDSIQSSATPKTPDYNTAGEDEHIFLYTAPESPKRRLDSGLRSSYDSSERCYSPVPKHSFEMQEFPGLNNNRTPSEHSHSSCSPSKATRRTPLRSNSNAANAHYQRTQSLVDNKRPITLMYNSSSAAFQRSDSDSPPTYITRPPLSPSAPPPATPIRRESLYAKPKIYASSPVHQTTVASSNNRLSSPQSPSDSHSPRINYYQLPSPPQRCSSAELLERSYTSQSLATIDQDEILVVPSAMPVLPNPVDRRYHTLGHMRVQSLGASLHRSLDSPMGSMLNMMSGSYYGTTHGPHHHHRHRQQLSYANKSAGNIYASAEAAVSDLNRLAPEYMDPLDFKIGCQTTLRSKPIIPWYELAIRRDFKRQSCPPISGPMSLTNGSQTLNNSRNDENKVIILYDIF